MINLNVKLKKNVHRMKMMYAASVESKGQVSMDELAERIAVRCTATKSDILAVLAALQERAKFALRNGQSVSMGPLGYLYLRCRSKMVENRDDFDAGQITGFVVGFRAKSVLRRHMQPGNGIRFKVNKIAGEVPVPPVLPSVGE